MSCDAGFVLEPTRGRLQANATCGPSEQNTERSDTRKCSLFGGAARPFDEYRDVRSALALQGSQQREEGDHMRESQLSTLAREIAIRVKKGKVLDEDLLSDFLSAVSEIVYGLTEATEELNKLARDLDAGYVFDDLAEDPVFCAGACWGAIGVYAKSKERERDAAVANARRDASERHRALLATIRDNPGITQQELGKALGKSKSNLAQILARLEVYRLFTVSPAGKYKRYHISSVGRRILEEIEGQERLITANRPAPNRLYGARDSETMEVAGILVQHDNQYGVIDVRNHGIRLPMNMPLRHESDVDVPRSNVPIRSKQAPYFENGAVWDSGRNPYEPMTWYRVAIYR